MTVSRVVNGGQLVSPETAARVRDAIDRLGYVPNEAARILKGREPKTIGLIVPDLADTFFSICAHAAQQLAAKRGYLTLLLASERDPSSELSELSLMKSHDIAGLLIVPSGPASILQLAEMSARNLPVVMLDRTFAGLDAAEVTVANAEGAANAVRHLVEHGHREILCLGYDSQFNSIGQRIEGYSSAMKEAGLAARLSIVNLASELDAQLEEQLRPGKRPTAIFSLNNVTTIHTLRYLQGKNISVPADMALIGFDDFEIAPLLRVPLTAVRQPAEEIGRTAVELLLDCIASRNSNGAFSCRKVVLPTELIVRSSCGCGQRLQ